MIRRPRALAVALLATALIAATGCSSADDDASSGGTSLEKVTYLTAFAAAGRDSFAWVAKEKGYFKEVGLDVDIQLGAAGGENLKSLAGGKAQYACLDLIGAWILAGEGTFTDFRTIAAVHQQSLVSIIALEGGGITSPKDLEGKKVGAATGSVNQRLFPAYAQLAGIDASKVQWLNTTPPQIPALLAANQVNAVSTFLVGQQGIETAAAGKKAVVLPYSQYLSDLFGNGIVTTSTIANDKPDQAKRFRDALMKGLKYTIEHPDEAAAILNKAQPASKVESAKAEITSMTPYVASTTAGAPIGSLDEQRVVRALAILQGSGLIPQALTPDSVVAFDLTPKA